MRMDTKLAKMSSWGKIFYKTPEIFFFTEILNTFFDELATGQNGHKNVRWGFKYSFKNQSKSTTTTVQYPNQHPNRKYSY